MPATIESALLSTRMAQLPKSFSESDDRVAIRGVSEESASHAPDCCVATILVNAIAAVLEQEGFMIVFGAQKAG